MVSEIDRKEHEQAMDEWRYNYPLSSAIMSNTKLTENQAMDLVKLGEERRSNS